MAILQFLAGTDFVNKSLSFQPGTIYLDTATGEMWFDDPQGVATDHAKIIDLDTLVYDIEEWVEFPSSSSTPGTPSTPGSGGTSSSTSAVLGIGILGKMKLGSAT